MSAPLFIGAYSDAAVVYAPDQLHKEIQIRGTSLGDLIMLCLTVEQWAEAVRTVNEQLDKPCGARHPDLAGRSCIAKGPHTEHVVDTHNFGVVYWPVTQ